MTDKHYRAAEVELARQRPSMLIFNAILFSAAAICCIWADRFAVLPFVVVGAALNIATYYEDERKRGDAIRRDREDKGR